MQGNEGNPVLAKLRDLLVMGLLGASLLVSAASSSVVGAATGWVSKHVGLGPGLGAVPGVPVSFATDTGVLGVLPPRLSGGPWLWKDIRSGGGSGGGVYEAGPGERRLEGRSEGGSGQAGRRADRGGERHHGDGAGFFEAQRGDQVVVGVGENLEAFLREHLGGLEQPGGIGQQRGLIADHFELHEVIEPGLASEARVPDGLVGAVAACRVRQQEEAFGGEVMQDPLLGIAIEIHATHGDGDHLGPRRGDGVNHLLIGAVLPGAHHETGPKGDAGNLQHSTTSDEMNDLHHIPVRERRARERGTADDDAIVFDDHRALVKPQLGEEFLDRAGLHDVAAVAVDD